MCNVYTHRVAQLKRSSEKMQIPQWDTLHMYQND